MRIETTTIGDICNGQRTYIEYRDGRKYVITEYISAGPGITRTKDVTIDDKVHCATNALEGVIIDTLFAGVKASFPRMEYKEICSMVDSLRRFITIVEDEKRLEKEKVKNDEKNNTI